jgi:hypothetical protein
MGLKPSDYAMLAGMVGGPLLGAAFAQDPQERESFAGTTVDPTSLMQDNAALLDTLLPLIMGRANAGVSLPSAYVQQPGAYTGGGLPMPIGLVASDPALANPNLLRIPGLSSMGGVPAGTSVNLGPDGNPAGPRNPGDGSQGWPGDILIDEGESGPMGAVQGQGASRRSSGMDAPLGPRRRMSGAPAPLFQDGDLIDPGADLQQALGSVELLLESLGGRGEQRV